MWLRCHYGPLWPQATEVSQVARDNTQLAPTPPSPRFPPLALRETGTGISHRILGFFFLLRGTRDGAVGGVSRSRDAALGGPSGKIFLQRKTRYRASCLYTPLEKIQTHLCYQLILPWCAAITRPETLQSSCTCSEEFSSKQVGSKESGE